MAWRPVVDRLMAMDRMYAYGGGGEGRAGLRGGPNLNRKLDPEHTESAQNCEGLPKAPKKYRNIPSVMAKTCQSGDDEHPWRITEDGGEIYDPKLNPMVADAHERLIEEDEAPEVKPFDVRQLGDDFTYAFFGKRRGTFIQIPRCSFRCRM